MPPANGPSEYPRRCVLALGAFEEKNPRNSDVAFLTYAYVQASRGERTTDLLQIVRFTPSADGDELVSATFVEGDQGTRKGSSKMNSVATSTRHGSRTTTVLAHQIPACHRLSQEEERHLAELIANGDLDVRNDMVRANLPLVVKIAHDFLGRGLQLDDLIGEGNLGLIRAAEDFESKFGTRFSTYASYWIKQSIRQALINTTTTIRLPAHMVGLLTRWRRTERALACATGRTPDFQEVASVLALSAVQKDLVSKARKAQSCGKNTSEVIKVDRNSADVGKEVQSDDSSLAYSDERLILSQRLERLDDREQAILNMRYGLDGTEPLTLKEIGRRLGITREWVRKIELRALRKLQDDETNKTTDSTLRKRYTAERRRRSPPSTRPFQPGSQVGL